jgi:hypothetical protein
VPLADREVSGELALLVEGRRGLERAVPSGGTAGPGLIRRTASA